MQQVVITGVSTGIGHAAARVLLNRGFRVRILGKLVAQFMGIKRRR